MTQVKIVEDSIYNDIRITTMQLKFHRFILPEFNTHRMFSRSVASNRAIPTTKQIETVKNKPAIPVHWGLNQPGMVATEELDEELVELGRSYWLDGMYFATQTASQLSSLGLHKQLCNRVLEPYQWVDVVVTATEWDNFFHLRTADNAQPEIQLLAKMMQEQYNANTPISRHTHLPYVTQEERFVHDETLLMKISAARCARVSYKNHDQTDPVLSKDLALYKRLVRDQHLSPLEHVAAAMDSVKGDTGYGYLSHDSVFSNWRMVTGITHCDRDFYLWSGNFRGWIQLRHMGI